MSRNDNDGLIGCAGLVAFWATAIIISTIPRLSRYTFPISLGICLPVFFAYLAWRLWKEESDAKAAKAEAERNERERQAWLQSREGVLWQQAENEKTRTRREDERLAAEKAARDKWCAFYESKSMEEIATMTGVQFEEFLAKLFERMGYTNITLTPATDQGGDVICNSPRGVRVAIQAKRWKGTVSNGAVQEVMGAMAMYDCGEGIVVTNSTFTRKARELAAKTKPPIVLRDGVWLAEQIKQYLPREIPTFSWDEYNRNVKDYQPPRQGSATAKKQRRRWRRG